MLFRFGEYSLDTARRELARRGDLIAVEPQVFDVLVYLIRNRERVVSKDDLLAGVWGGRIVSESTNLLPHISVPTLVLHCRGDAAVPFEEGRLMAAGIPGSRFVELEGRNHMILESDPATQRFLDEMRSFLAG